MTAPGERGVENFALGGRPGGDYRGTLHVGLVNNMPDAAMRGTELQFARLLKESSGAMDVRLHLFSIAQIPRGDVALSRMEGFYADARTLPVAGLDALIVTGAEPKEADLRAEPYWDALTHLIDWAEIGTCSTIFSCLAAHAAVLHLDGLPRRRLPRKLSGVFAAERAADDPLLLGLAPRLRVPHSRRNDVAESDLLSRQYRILSRLDGGVDSFQRAVPGRSLFLFLQGHPEYDAETLGREYLRDMGRFLRGETGERPAVPENYFDRATQMAIAELDAGSKGPNDVPRYNEIVMGALPMQSWRGTTVRLFANWLTLVAAEKMRRAPRAAAPRKRLSA